MHSSNRHYFAFFISEVYQVQHTKVQKDLKFAEFTMIELIYKAFESLSSSIKKFSLLNSANLFHLSMLVFYMNDFFDEFQIFHDLYEYLRDHFLSSIAWIKLRLFFKKMHLFKNEMNALKITHFVNDFIKILKNSFKRIAKWSILTNQIDVQAFLRVVEIIRQWIRNLVELFKLLV
jgi:hypothetical protein